MTIDKIRAIGRSAITYLTLLLLLVQALISELPGLVSEGVIGFLVRVAAWIAVAIVIIRRTVEVPKNQRSIL